MIIVFNTYNSKLEIYYIKKYVNVIIYNFKIKWMINVS